MSIAKIQFRRGTVAQWNAASTTVLAAGEPGFETDTGKVKVGNGSTQWGSLSYINSGGSLTPPVELVSGTQAQVPFAVAGASGQTGRLTEFRATTGGTVLSYIAATGDFVGPKVDINAVADRIPLWIKGVSGQSVDYIQVRSAANSLILGVSATDITGSAMSTVLSRITALENSVAALLAMPDIYTGTSAPANPSVGDGWLDPS